MVSMDLGRELRWLRLTAVIILITAVVAIFLISQGLFDPKPLGEEAWQQTVGQQTVVAGERRLTWLAHPPLPPAYSLRLTAVFQEGERDSAYGLLLGDEHEGWTAVTVSPLGNVAVWQERGGERTYFRDPAPFPHVRPAANEIWVDMADGQMTLRLNREWVWAGPATPGKQMGLIVESWGETAVVQFQKIQLFTP